MLQRYMVADRITHMIAGIAAATRKQASNPAGCPRWIRKEGPVFRTGSHHHGRSVWGVFALNRSRAAQEVDLWDWADTYRLTEKNIRVPVWNTSTEPCTKLDNARFWCNHKSFDSLEATARLHHRLVWVHPFANGNGRWARIMADAYLARLDRDIFLDWSGSGALNVDSAHRLHHSSASGRSAQQGMPSRYPSS